MKNSRAGIFLLWSISAFLGLGHAHAAQDAALVAATNAPASSEETLRLSEGTLRIGSGTNFLEGWELSKYSKPNASSEPMTLQDLTLEAAGPLIAFDSPELAYLDQVQGALSRKGDEVIWTYEDAKLRLERTLTPDATGTFVRLGVSVKLKTAAPKFVYLSIFAHSPMDDEEKRDRRVSYFSSGSVTSFLFNDQIENHTSATPGKWLGVLSRYFIWTMAAEGDFLPRVMIQPVGVGSRARASLVYPITGSEWQTTTRLYFGPQKLEFLQAVEPSLDNAVDFGWFTILAYPLLRLMKWFYEFSHNYGIAIILLTLLVKILTFPLTYKSMKSMKEMARIQPRMQQIREKYKDDRDRMNREMLTLMRSGGYNPLAGCLPLLIQMPVFFALYRVLYSSVELYQAPFMGWIMDLSTKDPYYVTPVLLTLVMFIQQKLTPNTATDPMQQRMLQFMPIMFGAFMVTLPSGLTLYMLVNTVAGIVQQVVLNKKFDTGSVVAAAKAR